MAGLVILTEIAFAASAFLLYFLYALWREIRVDRKNSWAEAARSTNRRREKVKLFHLSSFEEFR